MKYEEEINNHQRALRNDFARRCFLDIADEDYISARTLYRNDCRDNFLQSSQQAIEKYLKGILLFNGIQNNKPDHSISNLMNKCEKEISFVNFDQRTKNIISNLDGAEHNRYLTYSFSAKSAYLIELDYAVLMIRRYCQSDIENSKRLSNLDLDSLYKIYRSGYLIFGGKIESIIKNSKNKNIRNLYINLVWKNLYLGKKRKKINFQQVFWAKNSPISSLADREHFDSIKDYIYLPKDIKLYFNNTAQNEKPSGMQVDSVIFREIF